MFLMNMPLSIWQDTDKFAEMGQGYALYFKILKYLIFFLLFPLCFFSMFQGFYNYYGDTCMSETEFDRSLKNSLDLAEDKDFDPFHPSSRIGEFNKASIKN